LSRARETATFYAYIYALFGKKKKEEEEERKEKNSSMSSMKKEKGRSLEF